MNESEFIIVFEGTLFDVDILVGLLEANNITYFLQDNHMGRLAPHRISPGGISPVKVIVPKDEIEKAKPLVEDFITKSSTRE